MYETYLKQRKKTTKLINKFLAASGLCSKKQEYYYILIINNLWYINQL